MTDTNLSFQYRQEIENYLANNERTFVNGFALLQKFSNKLSLIAMIGRKCTPLMHKKIDYELKQIADRKVIKLSPYANKTSVSFAAAQSDKQAYTNASYEENKAFDALPSAVLEKGDIELKKRLKVVISKLDITPDDMPKAIAELYSRARKFYHLKRHYFTLMKAIPKGDKNNAQRAEALKLANEYETLNKEAWKKIDAWAEAGKPNLDEQKEESEPSTAELSRAIGSSKSYISRYADSLDKLTGKKYEARKEKLSEELKILFDNAITIPAKKRDVLTKHGLIEQ